MSNAFTKFFSRVGHDIVVVASKVKAVFEKAAQEEPAITNFLQTYGKEAADLLQNVDPHAQTIYTAAMTAWGGMANILDKGGAAAESNFLNQGFDQATIDAVKASISSVRAIAGGKPSATAAAPAAPVAPAAPAVPVPPAA